MSAAHNNSGRNERPQKTNVVPAKLEAPVRTHVYVWLFMVTVGVSPLLYILGTGEYVAAADWRTACSAVVLIQGLFWIAQRRCSSDDLSYWEGLLVTAASVETGSYLISLPLSFFLLLYTATASFIFALLHDAKSPTRHASLCFGRMIIAIHKRRLYR